MSNRNYQKYTPTYMPKKPVKSFQDLEVYQKALETSVFAAKALLPAVEASTEKKKRVFSRQAGELLLKSFAPTALGLPHLLAEAHSLRFGSGTECLGLLEKVMLNCNKLVVYTEQIRDICETGIAWEQFDELIKKYLDIRRKTLHLQRSWKKYILLNKAEASARN